MEPRTLDNELKPAIFTFRDCELDEAQRELRRGGRTIDTEPQILNLLFELVRQRHRVVPRTELRSVLWPEQRISDSAINACISRARTAIGEQKGGDRIIKTFSRFGYRFLADVEVRDAHVSTRRSETLSGLPSSPQLLGRTAELLWIGRALRNADGARTIFVSGNAGIGKTRLLHEAMQGAGGVGITVLWGRCDESDDPPPFWAWAQIVRNYAAVHTHEQTHAVCGEDIIELARLVPSLMDRREGLSAPPIDPDQARLRIYGAITSFLTRAAQLEPLLIILDDLQWIDSTSLLMLRSIARDLRALDLRVAGLFRNEEVSAAHPLAALVAAFDRERLCEHLKLSGIDSAAVHSMLRAAARDEIDETVLTEIDAQSEGNPLIALETLRQIERTPTADTVVGTIVIADGVRNFMLRRLRTVGSECHRILILAAVIGREFSLAQLQRIATITEELLIDLLDEAGNAGLISASGDAQCFRFAHPMFQHVLERDLNPVRRQRLRALLDG